MVVSSSDSVEPSHVLVGEFLLWELRSPNQWGFNCCNWKQKFNEKSVRSSRGVTLTSTYFLGPCINILAMGERTPYSGLWFKAHITSHKTSTAAAAAKSLQSCPTLVRPHRRQPTRLPCPWDSPGKNTGVGCHFLLKCMKVKSQSKVA